MAIIAKDAPMERLKLPEAGTVQGVCCAVWDLGLQLSFFKTEDGKDKHQHKVVIAWELSELINDPESDYNGLPYMLSKSYTLSLNEKANLRKDLESWRGTPFTEETIADGFDLEKLIGANCLMGVTHTQKPNGNTYANISAILPLPKGTAKIKQVRAAAEPAPKWVQELQAKALNANAEPQDPFGDLPELE